MVPGADDATGVAPPAGQAGCRSGRTSADWLSVRAYRCRLCLGLCFGFCWLTARAHTQHSCAIILPLSTLILELPTGSATPPFRGVRASSRSHARGGDRSQCTSQTRQERRQESVRTGHLPWIVPGVLGCASALVPRRGLTFWGAAGIPFCGLCAWDAVLRSLGAARPPASPPLTDQCSGPRRGLRLSALGISARRLLRRTHRL